MLQPRLKRLCRDGLPSEVVFLGEAPNVGSLSTHAGRIVDKPLRRIVVDRHGRHLLLRLPLAAQQIMCQSDPSEGILFSLRSRDTLSEPCCLCAVGVTHPRVKA